MKKVAAQVGSALFAVSVDGLAYASSQGMGCNLHLGFESEDDQWVPKKVTKNSSKDENSGNHLLSDNTVLFLLLQKQLAITHKLFCLYTCSFLCTFLLSTASS